MVWLEIVLGVLLVVSVSFNILYYYRRGAVVMPISPAPSLYEPNKEEIEVKEKVELQILPK
jgi:hypothetical protein